MNQTVVIMKTHQWNDSIEKFATKIYDETYPVGVDFFILMHTENNEIYTKIKTEKIKKIVFKFTENEIKSIYPAGFFSMWLSNHWMLMWFYKQYGQKYKYFWSIEYDVRILGDSSKLWKYESSYDFLYAVGNYRNSKNKYNTFYVGGKLTELQKYHGFLQLTRFSKNVLDYLDKCFDEGENGQDELIIFSLLNRGNFTGSKKFLHSLIRGRWTWETKYSVFNKKIYDCLQKQQPNNNGELYIFHPIK